MRATYSPDDNKLRIYPDSRLPEDEYKLVKEAGYSWAPKQELFVCPRWTPTAEDVAIDLCGEIEDEDTGMVDRAEERSDRFRDYSHKRAAESDQARKAVAAIADNIPFGSPILVGHHSEKHARKDAERIENGMRKTISLWETSQYWKQRAAGAIAHAKYKERPDVRARRIKTIEADKRRVEKTKSESEMRLRFWRGEMKLKKKDGTTMGLTLESAIWFSYSTGADGPNSYCFPVSAYPRTNEHQSTYEGAISIGSALGANIDGVPPEQRAIITLEQAAEMRIKSLTGCIAGCQRWLDHYDRRLEYERAMLEADGGLEGEKFQYEVGGRIQRLGTWHIIKRINKRDGVVNSLTCTGIGWESVTLEQVQGYEPPAPGDSEKVKAAMKVAPIVNYPGEGFLHQTKEEWEKTVPKWSDFHKYNVVSSTDTAGRHRVRMNREPGKEFYHTVGVYLTDQKRVNPPPPSEPIKLAPFVPPLDEEPAEPVTTSHPPDIAAMKQTLEAGVKVVTANQLFPTPPELAKRMVELAGIEHGHRVCEPSAGTGNIVKAIRNAGFNGDIHLDCIEINHDLCKALKASGEDADCRDFLEVTKPYCPDAPDGWDRIIMNPPFERGSDIKHINHALKFLKPGGRLVAICANGPKQRDELQLIASHWEDLPEGTFKESGTNVNTALLVIDA